MKRVLVISDNLELVSHFKNVSKDISSGIANFEYCYSIINKSPHKLKNIGMGVIDMRDMDCVKNIIENYDLVISAHCKQIFPSNLVNNIRCINIHPGYNPYNRGWYPQVFSIINKKPIGCTIHEMDEKIDHGSIIYQRRVNLEKEDTSLDIYLKVQEAEKKLITEKLLYLINDDYQTKETSFEGNYNGIKDFKDICKLDLNKVGTLAEHIDLLRALSHGSFYNGYFEDKGNRIYVRLELKSSDHD